MTLFKFTGSVVVEATSQEDALRQVGAHVGRVARHLGDGQALDANQPFFTLDAVDAGSAVDLSFDRIVESARAAEAAAAEAAQSAAPVAGETK